MRAKHVVRDEFKGWHIVEVETLKRQLVNSLSYEQSKLSPWGVWNDTLLKENLEAEWSPEKW